MSATLTFFGLAWLLFNLLMAWWFRSDWRRSGRSFGPWLIFFLVIGPVAVTDALARRRGLSNSDTPKERMATLSGAFPKAWALYIFLLPIVIFALAVASDVVNNVPQDTTSFLMESLAWGLLTYLMLLLASPFLWGIPALIFWLIHRRLQPNPPTTEATSK